MRFSTVLALILVFHSSRVTNKAAAQKFILSAIPESDEDFPLSTTETEISGLVVGHDEQELTPETGSDKNDTTSTEIQQQRIVLLDGKDTSKFPDPESSVSQQADSTVSPNIEKSATGATKDVKKESTVEYLELEATSDNSVTKERQWIQKIQTAKSRSLKNFTEKSPVKSVWFGKIITNVLYETSWSTQQTNPKCARDIQLYNTHIQNFTLWAAKSKSTFSYCFQILTYIITHVIEYI